MYNKVKTREYELKNAEKIAERKARYYLMNKERILARSKHYYENNTAKVLERTKNYKNQRMKIDPKYKLAGQLRTRLYKVLQSKKWLKNNTFSEYIGCSLNDLKNHLEKQFQSGMTWDNHGEWHIDHIVPLASAESQDEIYKLCHYTNLQPLWASENRTKQDKLNYKGYKNVRTA